MVKSEKMGIGQYTDLSEENARLTNVWNTIKLLYMRGAYGLEISKIIPELTLRDIGRAVDMKKSEGTRHAKYGGGLFPHLKTDIRGQREADTISPLDLERKVQFARAIFEAHLIGDNNACWTEYHDFCERNNIRLPESFFDRLRLEMYYSAIILSEMGDNNRRDHYNSIGNSINPEWFRESLAREEALLATKIHIISASLFRNGKGNIIVDDNGKVRYERKNEAIKRVKSRWEIFGQIPHQNDQLRGGRH